MHRERGNILLVIVIIALMVFLISLFHNENNFYDTFNLTGILRLSCGVTIEHPSIAETAKIKFPIAVEGYANGCGWEASGGSAGTAQVFDGKGTPVTKPSMLAVGPHSDKKPWSFTASLALITPPSTDTGYILLRSTTGLLSTIPIAF